MTPATPRSPIAARSFARTFVCVLALALAGCYSTPALITDRVLQSHERRLYLEYRDAAERRNLEREKAGLATQPVLEYREWRDDRR
jgi:hypothetical protein